MNIRNVIRPLLIFVAFVVLAGLPPPRNSTSQAGEAAEGKEPSAAKKKLPFTISKETTYITGPLKADGTVDYVAALRDLRPKYVPPEKNAVVGLIELFGFDESPSELTRKYLTEIGIPRSAKGKVRLKTISQFAEDYLNERVTDEESRSRLRGLAFDLEVGDVADPIPDELATMASAWLDRYADEIRELHATLNRPGIYLPTMEDERGQIELFGASSYLGHARDAGAALAFHARLMFLNEKYDELEKDLRGIFAVPRVCEQGKTIVDFLVAQALFGIGHETLMQWSYSGKMSPEAIRRWRTDLPRLTKSAYSLADAYDFGDRYFTLSLVQAMLLESSHPYRNRNEKLPAELRALFPYVPDLLLRARLVDADELLRVVNRVNDHIAKALRQPNHALRVAALKAHDKWLVEYCGSRNNLFFGAVYQLAAGKSLRRYFTRKTASMLFINDTFADYDNTRFALLCQKGELLATLSDIGLALAAYRAEHKSYPETLAKLVPAYLAKLPLDPITEKPLLYRKTGDGFVVYSVGRNGKDDGGRDTPFSERDDIGVGQLMNRE